MDLIIEFHEIPNELIRLLNLKSIKNLPAIAKTVQIHIREKELFISFKGTNRFEIAYMNLFDSISPSFAGQSYPNLFALTRKSILDSCPHENIKIIFLNPKRIETLATQKFLNDLLLNLAY